MSNLQRKEMAYISSIISIVGTNFCTFVADQRLVSYLGVSCDTVKAWESGTLAPTQMALKMLHLIQEDHTLFKKTTVITKRSLMRPLLFYLRHSLSHGNIKEHRARLPVLFPLICFL